MSTAKNLDRAAHHLRCVPCNPLGAGKNLGCFPDKLEPKRDNLAAVANNLAARVKNLDCEPENLIREGNHPAKMTGNPDAQTKNLIGSAANPKRATDNPKHLHEANIDNLLLEKLLINWLSFAIF